MKLAYRPEIDGLRTLAVVPVVLFHAGLVPFKGGFVGVDVFFVISGYLITSILLADLSKGSFSLLRFYDRRIRRIIPALLAVLLTSFVFAYQWMSLLQLREFAKDVVAVALFGSNIRYLSGSGYFDAAEQLRPLLHTWSLAIEEQFYVVFPLLLFAVWRWWRSRLLPSILILLVSSLVFAEYMSRTDALLNYYLLPTRAWELLAGAFLATKGVRPGGASRGVAEIGAGAGVLLIVVSIFLLGEEFRYPSLWTVLPVGGAMLVIAFADQRSFAGRVLASRPFVGIGLLSYSFYLWHLPVFAFSRIRFGQENLSTWDYCVLIGFSLALSWITYLVLERPIRRQAFATTLKVGGLALAATILLIAGARFTVIQAKHGLPFRNPIMVELDRRLRMSPGLSEHCDGEVDEHSFCKTGEAPVIAVWGDSHARQLVDGILASKPDVSLIQLVKPSCPPDANPTSAPETSDALSCRDFNRRVKAWLSNQTSVTHVVLAMRLSSHTSKFNSGSDEPAASSDGGEERDKLMRTADWIRRQGMKPVLFTSPPATGMPVGRCLYRARAYGGEIEKCSMPIEDVVRYQGNIDKIYRSLELSMKVVRLEKALCDQATCHATVGDVYLYADSNHLTSEGSRYLGKKMGFYDLIMGDDPSTRRGVRIY
ncbi:acyltransferase family protein [Breoghania sp.]|uniref:acyltransferase family protein n=1 Tax=Breoghania sp. TaxID=2065378 RepID=UPI002AAB20F1|nr:acyltransferase family protein [Breoghania sp.]